MADHTYFFQPEKKILKQGFFMTDEDKNVVYEAKMLKQPILGAMEFEFINHITGQSGVHKVGHTVTTETSGLFEFFSIKSSFKYDGENIWDYLHGQGIRIDSSIAGDRIGMSYRISLKGKDMAENRHGITRRRKRPDHRRFLAESDCCRRRHRPGIPDCILYRQDRSVVL